MQIAYLSHMPGFIVYACIWSLIPYSRKYWRSLNLAVWPKTMFLTPLVDLNLVVWYSIAIRTCTRKKNLAVLMHTTKLPNLIPHQIFWLYGISFLDLNYCMFVFIV